MDRHKNVVAWDDLHCKSVTFPLSTPCADKNHLDNYLFFIFLKLEKNCSNQNVMWQWQRIIADSGNVTTSTSGNTLKTKILKAVFLRFQIIHRKQSFEEFYLRENSVLEECCCYKPSSKVWLKEENAIKRRNKSLPSPKCPLWPLSGYPEQKESYFRISCHSSSVLRPR